MCRCVPYVSRQVDRAFEQFGLLLGSASRQSELIPAPPPPPSPRHSSSLATSIIVWSTHCSTHASGRPQLPMPLLQGGANPIALHRAESAFLRVMETVDEAAVSTIVGLRFVKKGNIRIGMTLYQALYLCRNSPASGAVTSIPSTKACASAFSCCSGLNRCLLGFSAFVCVCCPRALPQPPPAAGSSANRAQHAAHERQDGQTSGRAPAGPGRPGPHSCHRPTCCWNRCQRRCVAFLPPALQLRQSVQHPET